MKATTLHYAYLSVLGCALLIGLVRLRHLDRGGKIFCLLLAATALAEFLALASSRLYHHNLSVYNVFGLVQLSMVCLYFNETIDLFRRYNVGWYLIIAALITGVANFWFLQPMEELSSNYLLLIAVATISMSLFSFARLMLRSKERSISHNPHFWFPAILTFFWSITFISWGLIDYTNANRPSEVTTLNSLLLFANIVTYAGFGIVFLLYPYLQRKL